MTLKDGAFTGSAEQGNPYAEDLEKGIAYDRHEANTSFIDQSGFSPKITTMYHAGASKLADYLPASSGQRVLDMGSGTGISTLELMKKHPEIKVLGIDDSKGMLAVAGYKFHHKKGDELKELADDPKLLEYWEGFRKQSRKYSNRVSFLHDDFQATDQIAEESLDAAFGNQFMHWTDISKAFRQLGRFLKDSAPAVWNSASHFYADPDFPSSEYGFRYNDFLAYVLEDISKHAEVEDYKTLSRPKHDLGSIQGISRNEGLETRQIGTYLVPVDLQVFIQKHVPVFVRQLVKEDIGKQGLEELTRTAVAKAVNNPAAMSDTRHKYDIVPVFESRKRL